MFNLFKSWLGEMKKLFLFLTKGALNLADLFVFLFCIVLFIVSPLYGIIGGAAYYVIRKIVIALLKRVSPPQRPEQSPGK